MKTIIDVREPEEFNQGHVEGALNVPLGLLDSSAEIAKYPKDAPIIVYCRSGARAGMGKALLEQQGFTNVTNGIDQTGVEKLLSQA